jgi:sugar/nucleoside kinase (ribokinase family)
VVSAKILVAGHACVDLFPEMSSALPEPGGLAQVGALRFSGGGVVSNVGVGLKRLGVPVRLLARTGDDQLGQSLREVYLRAGLNSTDELSLVTVTGGATSYSVVVQVPGEDRRFLHCPGVNDTFEGTDVSPEALSGCRHLHFGYPTIMRSMWADGGVGLAGMLRRARDAGLSTSVDLSHPDPESPAARADWDAILRRVLPEVDLFCPSVPEVRLILRAERASVEDLAAMLLRRGGEGGAVVLKDGDRGLYCRTGKRASEWAPPGWEDVELRSPCYRVKVVGTTGSGDATIAGLLAGLYEGLAPREALDLACAVGASCCEAMDAVSGIRPLAETKARMKSGWERLA